MSDIASPSTRMKTLKTWLIALLAIYAPQTPAMFEIIEYSGGLLIVPFTPTYMPVLFLADGMRLSRGLMMIAMVTPTLIWIGGLFWLSVKNRSAFWVAVVVSAILSSISGFVLYAFATADWH